MCCLELLLAFVAFAFFDLFYDPLSIDSPARVSHSDRRLSRIDSSDSFDISVHELAPPQLTVRATVAVTVIATATLLIALLSNLSSSYRLSIILYRFSYLVSRR